MSALPRVSVIVPCFNEADTIDLLLNAVHSQTYDRDAMQVLIADGMSDDGTRDLIAAFSVANEDLDVRVVDNPARNIPAALNRALEAADGDIIVRLDAHSVPDEDYVTRCVAALSSEKGDVVGGVWQIMPGAGSWPARAIARAAAHPLGVGDARYRYTDKAQQVDTVPFGAYRKRLIDEIGPYDETLFSNEDYEFNTRVRDNGGKLWLDPAIRTIYFARRTYTELARQYSRYGFWKAQMLKRYPRSLRLRQALPPLFVLGIAVLLALAWLPACRLLLGSVLAAYCLPLGFAGTHAAMKHNDLPLVFGLPIAIAIMHLSWGAALLVGLLARPSRPID